MEKNKNYFYRLLKENNGFSCIPFDPEDKHHYKYTYYIKWTEHKHDTTDNIEILYDVYVSDIMTDLGWYGFSKGGYVIYCTSFISAFDLIKNGKKVTFRTFEFSGREPNNNEFHTELFFPSDIEVYHFAKFFMEALSLLEKYKDNNKVFDVFKTLYGPGDELEKL